MTPSPASRIVGWILLLGCLIPAGEGFAAPAGPSAGSPERRLLDLVNAERTKRGLRRLAWDEDLARLARLHADDMRSHRKVTHESSADGAEFSARLARSGYRASAGAENVAMDRNVERAHEGLMNSSGHRRNILDEKLTAIGIGLAPDPSEDSVYVVQDFATALAVLTDEEAARRVRNAMNGARPPGKFLDEDTRLSSSFTPILRGLIERDSVKVDAGVLPGPGWVVAYTIGDPSELPLEARRALKNGRGREFGLAVLFGQSRSQPFGAYWVLMGLLEGP